MKSVSLPDLRRKLADLEATAAQIRAEGEYLQGVRLERSPAGGTASPKSKTGSNYARLRVGTGGTLANGQKSQYVRLKEIPQYEAAIARGKQLTKIQRQIATIQQDIDRLLEKLAALGIDAAKIE